MGQKNIKTSNPKYRLYWCFNRVYRLGPSVMLVFSTSLVNQRPSNLLTGSLPPLQGYVFIHCVEGGGGIRLFGEHLLKLCTVYFT
jgi:hypothetical protein